MFVYLQFILSNMENKKVRNAKEVVFDNIKFKSTLEGRCYRFLQKSNVEFKYEPIHFTLSKGFVPTIHFYEPIGKHLDRKLTKKGENYKVMSITYTPDFIVYFPNVIGIIEAKGKENDVYPLKEKLFRKLLETNNPFHKTVVFFKVKSVRQLNEALQILNVYNIG